MFVAQLHLLLQQVDQVFVLTNSYGEVRLVAESVLTVAASPAPGSRSSLVASTTFVSTRSAVVSTSSCSVSVEVSSAVNCSFPARTGLEIKANRKIVVSERKAVRYYK